eukprot:GHVU01080042.1.p1 GENE.GHVU01080042.1~~GHVU01080042.1.p1  ORF type:complete len:200 (-),score=21.44 GHVU01080042.1:514-1113(-)
MSMIAKKKIMAYLASVLRRSEATSQPYDFDSLRDAVENAFPYTRHLRWTRGGDFDPRKDFNEGEFQDYTSRLTNHNKYEVAGVDAGAPYKIADEYEKHMKQLSGNKPCYKGGGAGPGKRDRGSQVVGGPTRDRDSNTNVAAPSETDAFLDDCDIETTRFASPLSRVCAVRSQTHPSASGHAKPWSKQHASPAQPTNAGD